MIGYYLHHQGQGHRRRGTAIARNLSQQTTGLGTGGAPPGWPGEWISLAADDQPPVPDREYADVTAHELLHWAPRYHPGLAKRHEAIVRWLAAAQPDLVVVDVSVEIALLVRLCGIPVVVGGMPGERTDPVHTLAYDLADAILAPWPESAHPDDGWQPSWRAKTRYVGGISALADDSPLGPGTPRTSGPAHVLVVWGSGGDPLCSDDLEAARAATPGWHWVVRGGGYPVSSDLMTDLAAADVVVCHAGQGSVADVAHAGRPAVVLAQDRPHGEQQATARALDRLGLAAVASGWPDAEAWPALLSRALDLGGERWALWGSDGAKSAAQFLEDFARRLRMPHTAQGALR